MSKKYVLNGIVFKPRYDWTSLHLLVVSTLKITWQKEYQILLPCQKLLSKYTNKEFYFPIHISYSLTSQTFHRIGHRCFYRQEADCFIYSFSSWFLSTVKGQIACFLIFTSSH